MSGYIHFYRSAIDSWLWEMPAEQTKVAMTILAMANWKDGSTFSNGELVKVQRGQVMTSLQKLSERSKVSIRTVRTSLKNLEKCDFLTDQPARRFRILTIRNYEQYQSSSETERHTDRQQTDTRATADRQQSDSRPTTIEEGNKGRREKGNKGRIDSASRAHLLPTSWIPSDAHRSQAQELNLDLNSEASKFRDHAEANGRTQKNWNASFRLWMKRSHEFGAKRPAATGKKSGGLSAQDIWKLSQEADDDENGSISMLVSSQG